jgi:hypothetical protein
VTTLCVVRDVGYCSYAVSTATSVSEIGAGLFHFIFEALVSLFEEPGSNELQKEPDNNERGRRKESKDVAVHA